MCCLSVGEPGGWREHIQLARSMVGRGEANASAYPQGLVAETQMRPGRPGRRASQNSLQVKYQTGQEFSYLLGKYMEAMEESWFNCWCFLRIFSSISYWEACKHCITMRQPKSGHTDLLDLGEAQAESLLDSLWSGCIFKNVNQNPMASHFPTKSTIWCTCQFLQEPRLHLGNDSFVIAPSREPFELWDRRVHSIVGLIKTSSAMTIPNGFPDGPVLLGQRTLGVWKTLMENDQF